MTEALEQQWWADYKSGDQNAFQLLFRKYYPTLYTYGFKMLPNAASVEDIIQEMFLELWGNKRLVAVTSIKAYLFGILKYKILRQLNNGVTLIAEDGNILETTFTINSETLIVAQEEQEERVKKVTALLQNVSARQREIIYLRYYKNMSYEEISEVMKINYQASRNLLNQALKALRNHAIVVSVCWVVIAVVGILLN